MKRKGSRFFTPDSINELKKLVLKEDVTTLLAGGTTLFRTNNGENLILPGVIVILDSISELKRENRTERYFEFGSMITIEDIIFRCKNNYPKVFIDCLKSIAPFPIRNMATIGGSVANNIIISDLMPMLLIFNCKVEVISFISKKVKAKWEPIAQYISNKDERGLHLITRIRIPLLTPSYILYFKSGHKYNLFNEISFAGIAETEKENISYLSMAFNIENKIIVRTKEIEEQLIGKRLPNNHQIRETFMKSILLNLGNNKKLKKSQIYRMSQIILDFIEDF